MYTLIAFATSWGTRHGGINSFNADFISAFGVAYHHTVRTICVVPCPTAEDVQAARAYHVELIKLPHSPQDGGLDESQGRAAVAVIPDLAAGSETVWLGHDRITGLAAVAAARATTGRSAVIHHMSYEHYESYADSSAAALAKTTQQRQVFGQTDILLAVGPLLRDALGDLVGCPLGRVQMLVPGLAEIETALPPSGFSVFLSGRLTADGGRIKQSQLGIAAVAHAQREANEDLALPASLRQPKLKLRGVDLERSSDSGRGAPPSQIEAELKEFAERYAHRVVNLHALPYTKSRDELFGELRTASVAMMPSWHEGFGLVAWEAIAAGVPLIVSKNSGVFRLLEEKWPGLGPGCVYPVDVRGLGREPFFREEDLHDVANVLKLIASDQAAARRKASSLRALVSDCTWAGCVEDTVTALGWNIQRGVIAESGSTALGTVLASGIASRDKETTVPGVSSPAAIAIPGSIWRRGLGIADSQLLRAEEACVPFDPARTPELEALRAWADTTEWILAIRLITGAGGAGKTRLAIELCNRLVADGWQCGFLESAAEPSQLAGVWRDLLRRNQPALVVIDYAETRQPALLALVKAMLHSPIKGLKTRILLLARDGGEWWEDLPARDAACESLLAGSATSGPFALPELHAKAEARAAAYVTALRAYATALGVAAPSTVPELRGSHFGRPLYLQMAALLALHGERPATAEGLTRALINHEHRYWRGLLTNYAISEPERSAALLMSLSTLAGGFGTDRQAEPLWSVSGGLLDRASFKVAFRVLATLYPGRQGLQPLRPDLLGESLVARTLLGTDGDSLLDAVLGRAASELNRRHALTVLARAVAYRDDLDLAIRSALGRHFVSCAEALVSVATETLSRLPLLAEAAFASLGRIEKSQVAGVLDSLLPTDSVQLGELTCQVREFIVEKERQKAERNPRPAELASYGRALDRSGVSLAMTGHLKRALDASESATTILGRANQTSSRYRDYYFSALCGYADRLGQVGRHEESIEQYKVVVDIGRNLAISDPEQHERNYATILGNYSQVLTVAGRLEEALKIRELAVDRWQKLAKKRPEQHEIPFAVSLSGYSRVLLRIGRSGDAVAQAKASVQRLKKLVELHADRVEPDYADALRSLAWCLVDVDDMPAAVQYGEESLRLFAKLARIRPRRFEILWHLMRIDMASLRWLAREPVAESEVITEDELSPHLLDNHRRDVALNAAFVRGCITADSQVRVMAMGRVCALWLEAGEEGVEQLDGAWLCAVAYLRSIGRPPDGDQKWQEIWDRATGARKGRVYCWMADVASRLDFVWPP